MADKIKKVVRLCFKCFQDQTIRRKAGAEYAGSWKYNYNQSANKSCKNCRTNSRHGLETEIEIEGTIA